VIDANRFWAHTDKLLALKNCSYGRRQFICRRGQAEHSFTALADNIQELFEACRETIENAHDCIDQSTKARERAKELLAAARRLKTH
jgi:hypothetical protein